MFSLGVSYSWPERWLVVRWMLYWTPTSLF